MSRWLCMLLAVLPAFVQAAPGALIPEQSEIRFSVKQMGVPIDGHFRRFAAHINLDLARIEAATAEVQVDIGSLATGETEVDTEALKGAWLDAAAFPQARFLSRSVRTLGGGRYEAHGTLTIKGRARELSVPFTRTERPDGTTVYDGGFSLRRSDFGIGGGEWNAADLVANEVPVHFRITLAAP